MQLERPSRIAVLSVLLFCCAFGAGCGKRPLTEKVVVGTYKAEADWGESILILHQDHTFEQTVARNDHTQATTKGTWKLGLYDGKDASDGIIV